MNTKKIKTYDQIKEMDYTEFLSFVNQWNVPPGALSTISEWATYSQVDRESKVLEIGCTTGFSSRELTILKHCKTVGIDICNESIMIANYNKDMYARNEKVEYICQDIFNFNTTEKYTHIILGAAICVFEDKKRLIDKCVSLMDDTGYLLVSPYYLKDDSLPEDLIIRAKKVLGMTPTNFDYYVAMEPYKDFEIVYQDRKCIMPESRQQMEKYCKDIIDRACIIHEINDKEIYNLMYNKLYEIKDICNELHKRHAYDVMVLRYRKNIYPNRYVELF